MEWIVVGMGDFSGNANKSDMLMRNTSTGVFELYEINNNAITMAASLGQVGTEWAVAGFADLSGAPGETDMLMRNTNTGAFEVYDISHNALTGAQSIGQAGTEWLVSGVADDPPGSASALIAQAMASYAPGATPSASGAPAIASQVDPASELIAAPRQS